jgi:hypothetical protein
LAFEHITWVRIACVIYLLLFDEVQFHLTVFKSLVEFSTVFCSIHASFLFFCCRIGSPHPLAFCDSLVFIIAVLFLSFETTDVLICIIYEVDMSLKSIFPN